MAAKEKDHAAAGADLAKRQDAGTHLLGIVGALIGPLAELERACARKRPGRLNSVDWVSDTEDLQQTVEKQCGLLADLGGQLQRAAGEVAKVTPYPKEPDERPSRPAELPKNAAGPPTSTK